MPKYLRFIAAGVIMTATLLCGTTFAQTALLIYGGESHDQFLGCLNCGKYDRSSIWYSYGNYGSRYSSSSIWNDYSVYGGKYGQYSPFNAYSRYPPVVVDRTGNFYGYLSVNRYQDKRCNQKLALILYEYWQDIKTDLSEWYDKIFSS